ncbi:MAG: hypothetical protein L0212_05055, partial [Acidobacteria bacterium]|nr:hypothetical protein [Acidobacteriota bacterium]
TTEPFSLTIRLKGRMAADESERGLQKSPWLNGLQSMIWMDRRKISNVKCFLVNEMAPNPRVGAPIAEAIETRIVNARDFRESRQPSPLFSIEGKEAIPKLVLAKAGVFRDNVVLLQAANRKDSDWRAR